MKNNIEIPKTSQELVDHWLPNYLMVRKYWQYNYSFPIDGPAVAYHNSFEPYWFKTALAAFAESIEREAKKNCQKLYDKTYDKAYNGARDMGIAMFELYRDDAFINIPSLIKK